MLQAFYSIRKMISETGEFIHFTQKNYPCDQIHITEHFKSAQISPEKAMLK